jgi:DNA-binding NtrC family response regulator
MPGRESPGMGARELRWSALAARVRQPATLSEGPAAGVSGDPSWRGGSAIDLMMPGMDGFELAGRLCERLPQRPLLIAVSGSLNRQNADRLLASTFDHHFLKPVEPAELLAALKAHAMRRAAEPCDKPARLPCEATRILAKSDQRSVTLDLTYGRRADESPVVTVISRG